MKSTHNDKTIFYYFRFLSCYVYKAIKDPFLEIRWHNIHKLLFLLVFIAGCSNSSKNIDKEFLILCYNKEFGQRFSLPEDKAVVLSKGLYAIGVGQSKRTGIRMYLYLDSSLDIYSPKGCGDFCGHNRYHYFLNFNEKDQDLHSDKVLKQSNRILLRSKSMNSGNVGFLDGAYPIFFKRDILPELSIFAVGGVSAEIFECEYGPIEILIQKNNTGDSIFRPNGPVDHNRVYHFDIPDKLIKHLKKHIKEDDIISEENPIKIYYP